MNGSEAVCATKGSSTETACLAGAYAVARNTINVVKGLQGQKEVIQCAYVDSLGTCAPECQFFASEVSLRILAITNFTLGLCKELQCLTSKPGNCLKFNNGTILKSI